MQNFIPRVFEYLLFNEQFRDAYCNGGIRHQAAVVAGSEMAPN